MLEDSQVASASKPTRWTEFALVGAALVIAAALWWGARGRSPYQPGAVVELPVTLVAADKGALSCALDRPIETGHCQFSAPGIPWAGEGDAEARQVFVPAMTTESMPVLVAGLFTWPAVAERVASDLKTNAPRAKQKRFTVVCRARLVERIDRVAVQFDRGAAWDSLQKVWAAVPESCSVREP